MVNTTPRVIEMEPISVSEYPRSTQKGLTIRPRVESPTLKSSTKSTTGTISQRRSQRRTGARTWRRSVAPRGTLGLSQAAPARAKKRIASATHRKSQPV